MLLLLQASLPWAQFISFGPGFVALVLILIFLIRMAPTWKEVKIRELDLRSTEVTVRGEEAKALCALSDVLRDVAVEQRKATDEQRKATETIDILQRVNSDASDRLSQNVQGLNERLDREREDLIRRVGALEANVQPESTTAGT